MNMKICHNCITEIPINCKRCPNCGKEPDKEPNKKPLIIILILTIILFLGIGITSIKLLSKNDTQNKSLNPDNEKNVSETKGSFLKGEKTIKCSKESNDNGTTTKDEYTFVIKNDIIKELSETQTTKYSDNSGEMAYGFTKLMIDAMSDVEGMETSITDYKDNAFTHTMKINYDKLNIDDLKKAFNNDSSFDESSYDKNMKFDEYKSKHLDGYTCN